QRHGRRVHNTADTVRYGHRLSRVGQLLHTGGDRPATGHGDRTGGAQFLPPRSHASTALGTRHQPARSGTRPRDQLHRAGGRDRSVHLLRFGGTSIMASPPLRHNTKKNRTKPKAPPIVTGKARPLYVARTDVLTAARNRMRWIFDEFDGNVSVSNSGGKDSTVVLELAAEVTRENGVKLKVVWLDQEAKFGSTVDYQRYIMYERDDIDFHWYQIPFKLFNGTSHDANWLNVWGEGEEWVRPKEPNSIHENTFLDRNGQPIDRFKPLLGAMNKEMGGAILTGMRAEESPGRRI